ncbi:hypothetical protein ABZX85_10625 [Streptomyces sp. NPDC004539]|uniref:hypothetical protein n=1 Tax=Streptomyces sp. NPDC004539 TaxID=3154280 RepID=UPI0033B2C200
MRGKRIGSGAAMLAGALAVTGLALAPTAAAVTPTTATFTASCGIFGGGAATLTATQTGTAATLKLSTTAVKAPLAIGANTINSTLTMVNSAGPNRVFTGTVNPAMAINDPITVGPLNGTVASGDTLDIYNGGLVMVVFGITVTCTATGPQTPAFVYD